MNPYDVLGVPRGASPDAVAAAFRKLAKATHPDLNPGDPKAAARFAEIKRAYEAIRKGDPGNEALHSDEGWSGFARKPRGTVTRKVSITLEEAFFGRTVTIPGTSGECRDCDGTGFRRSVRRVACFRCQGTGVCDTREDGFFRVRMACPDCSGSGHSTKIPCPSCAATGRTSHREAEVVIPPGCRDGTEFTVSGAATDAISGAVADLRVVVEVIPHPTFRVSGINLETDIRIDVWDAALGVSVSLPALAGGRFLRLNIPAGTQHGSRFRLKGQGMPSPQGPGDLIVTVQVRIPDASSGPLRNLFSSMRDQKDAT